MYESEGREGGARGRRRCGEMAKVMEKIVEEEKSMLYAKSKRSRGVATKDSQTEARA